MSITGGTWNIMANGYAGELSFSLGDRGKVTGTIRFEGLQVNKIDGWAGPVANPDAIFFMRFDEDDEPVQMFSGFYFRGPNVEITTIGGNSTFVGVGRPYTAIFGWYATPAESA